MKPAAFEYHAPATAEEAVALLAELGDDAKVLAGGQSLIPMLALRLTAFEHLVDIGRIADLTGIERRGDAVRIGAGTTEAAAGRHPLVVEGAPLVAKATPLIGHAQIRNRGTVGGSIAHADPAAEYPALVLALDAELEAIGPNGRRTIAADGFFTGLWSTALEPDELLVGVSFPVWSGRSGFAIEELARRHGDYAVAGAAVGVELDADDRIARCAIGLIGLGSTPLRAPEAEARAVGLAADDADTAELGRVALAALPSVPSDLHGSAAYRTRVGAAMVDRALGAAIREAREEAS